MFHFNQANIEGKKYVWTKKSKKLLEMCFVQHVEIENVLTFQPMKRLVSTTAKVQNLMSRFEYSFEGP